MMNLVKVPQGSKTLKNYTKTHKASIGPKQQPEKYLKDDQEDSMISGRSKYHVDQQLSRRTSTDKIYRIFNPNLNEAEFQKSGSNWPDFTQLSLKNLIVFLLVLSMVMVGIYKIVQEIGEIQHPNALMAKKLSENRISMAKQNSLDTKQQIKAQEKNLVLGDHNDKGPTKVGTKLNTQQPIQQMPSQATQIDQNLQRSQSSEEHSHNQQGRGSKHSEEIQSALKQKEQDIENLLNQKSQQFISTENVNNDRTQIGNGNNDATKNKRNPTIMHSQNTLWHNDGTPPIAKANITKQQATKWKSYVKMLELPLGMPIQSDPMLKEQYKYFQDKYKISHYQQLPICVVIPSFNNAKDDRYKVNIQSVLQQNYSNYHVVFIDDMSEDKTGYLVEDYVNSFEPKYKEKVKVIINQERKMAMPNLRYAAMNQCKENELFIIIDGDDSLIGRQVFKLFSAVMQQRDLWVMWTNFLSPKGSIGYSRDYPAGHKKSNNYRKAGFVMSHLRAYYTKLFRSIKQQDLKDENGEYYHAANDVAIGIPILEMAHMHTGYIPEISYFYNMNTGLNNHRVRLKEQKSNDKKIRTKPKYSALDSLGFADELNAQKPRKRNQVDETIDMDQMEANLHKNAVK